MKVKTYRYINITLDEFHTDKSRIVLNNDGAVITIKNVCTNGVRLYIETWSQFVSKKSFHARGSQPRFCISLKH